MKNQEIRIQDLIPEESYFKLKLTGKTYRLHPCTPGRLISISKKYQDPEKMLAYFNAENVSKLAMCLMVYEDAVEFKKQEVKFIDVDTGEEREESIGGYKLLINMISSIEEQIKIYLAILKSMGWDEEKAQEHIDKVMDAINGTINEEINKNDNPLKKKRRKRNT